VELVKTKEVTRMIRVNMEEIIKERVREHKCTLCGKDVEPSFRYSIAYKTTGLGPCCEKHLQTIK
jgi:hypothetical protein